MSHNRRLWSAPDIPAPSEGISHAIVTQRLTLQRKVSLTHSPSSPAYVGVCSGDSLSSLRPRGRVFIHRDSLLLRRIPPAEPHSGRDRSVQFCLWVHVRTISKTYLGSLAGERSCVRTCGSLTNTSFSPRN